MILRPDSRLRAVTSLSCLCLGVALVACGDQRPEPAPAATRPTARAETPEAAPAPTPAPALAEADARAILDAWVAAQNAGNFDAYAALYASRFSGVKRTPERTTAFDREGWMRDRRRMFGRAMTVSASDVVIRTTSGSADLAFTQRWASGTYSDEGPKRITLVREGGALKIATEEMLAAVRLGELDAALEVGLFVAMPAAGGALAILAPAHANESVGAARLVSSDDPIVVGKDAGANAPASLRALASRTVTVIERDKVCAGSVAETLIVRVVVPHFSVVQAWEGRSDDGTEGRPMPASARASEAWSLGTYTYYAARVTSECTNPVGLSFAPTANVTSYVPRTPTAPERTALRRAFERTSRFAALERTYEDFVAGAGGEPDPEHPAPPAQRAAWAAADSTVVFTHDARSVATVVHNSEGCGGFAESAWASFELGAGAPTEHRPTTSLGDYISVIAVFDQGGDGTLEAIVRQGVGGFAVVRLAPTPSVIRRVEVDYLDCPC